VAENYLNVVFSIGGRLYQFLRSLNSTKFFINIFSRTHYHNMASITVEHSGSQGRDPALSFKTEYASRAIRAQIAKIQDTIDLLPPANFNKIIPIGNTLPASGSDTADRKFKVGIVGAGSAGLFTAMLFDHLKAQFNLNVEYEILERNDESRVGGRLYTYHFPGDKHQYFDVGAMRFPNIAIMKR